MNSLYSQEFELNLENQITNKIKEPMQVGYQIDNEILFVLIIPNIFKK